MIKSTVSTPVPHHDYTVRHNRHLQELDRRRVEDSIQKNKAYWHDFYVDKQHRTNDEYRIRQAQQRDRETQEIRQYEVLDRNHAYRDYKYQYYIGTLFDTYI